jgi:hypothetical protein
MRGGTGSFFSPKLADDWVGQYVSQSLLFLACRCSILRDRWTCSRGRAAFCAIPKRTRRRSYHYRLSRSPLLTEHVSSPMRPFLLRGSGTFPPVRCSRFPVSLSRFRARSFHCGARQRSGSPLRSTIIKAAPAAIAEPSIRYHAGAMPFPVAAISAVAISGAVPPAMPIPRLKDTE